MNLVNEGVLPPDELDDRDERREEQESARRRETVADIVAEIRAYGAQPPPRCMWLDIADRVETAARRERDHAVEHATRHAEAVARDNCRDCVHNPRGKNYEGGNAAAMCDIVTALANVILPPRGKAGEDGWLAWVRAMQAKARAALAAPPRQCDVGTDAVHGRRRRREVSRRNNCMFLLPYELTGMGECCGLFKGQLGCNGYGKRCVAYMPHNAESRKALAEAIAERRKQTREARDE